ncbi:glycosyltransferase family 9 protein [Paenibacillus sp. KACC 21273]|uniref:glycosyltransferase family 9 protein n=1 Tax=Paenibacillus sp. KACC 21273 TaxID=3025665 RepID=UPI002365B110|nr:glycosyltransferase family 9 protein [Paenibacillus sp. KACC 21273]WDF52844.1 glycosyltransferase family 9 protein [Paenibacillus sp. KACC 21273]
MRVFLTNYIQQWRKYSREPKDRILVLTSRRKMDEVDQYFSELNKVMIVLNISSFKVIEPLSAQVRTFYLNENMDIRSLDDFINNSNILSNQIDQALFLEYEVELFGFLIELRPKSEQRILEIATEELIKIVPNDFYLSGWAHFRTDDYYLNFSNMRKNNINRTSTKKVALTLGWPGYGDSIMMFQSIQKFINRSRDNGYTVDIITNHRGPYNVLKEFLRDCSILIMNIHPTHYLFEMVLQSGQYLEVYQNSVLWFENIKPQHATEIWTKSLNIHENPTFSSSFEMPSIPEKVGETLQNLKHDGRVLIGIQFYTGDDKRSWSSDLSKKFIKLCLEKKYAVINLAPSSSREITDLTYDVSHIKVTELVPLISQLDLVVGIDSCCGHIAGVLGVPNITLWGLNYPFSSNPLGTETCHVGFRPVRMNYSIVPVSTLIDEIDPIFVFEKVENILDGKINLKHTPISTQESLEGVGIAWVAK